MRDNVHHVGIILDDHLFFDMHRTVFANAAQVIAAQIDQHDMFGALFRVGEQIIG